MTDSRADVLALEPPDARVRCGRWLAFAVGVLPAVLFILLAFQTPVRLVRYLSDDAFYYFQVAQNLAAGQGPTFDGLTRTTGFHPLYALLLAWLGHLLSLTRNGIVVAAILLNGTCYYLTGLFLHRAAALLWGRSAATCASLAWLSNPHAILLVATGMEGSLYAACLAGLLWRLAAFSAAPPVSASAAWRGWIWLGAWGALCAWARTDAIIVLLVLALYPAFSRSGPVGQRLVASGVLAAAALGAWLAWSGFCWQASGRALSGSADMKMLLRELASAGSPLWRQGLAGLAILATWIEKSAIKVPLFKYAAVFLVGAVVGRGGFRNRTVPRLVVAALFAWLALGCAYAVLLPRIWTWYYAPALAIFALATAWAWHVAADGLGDGTPRAARLRRWLVVALAMAAVESYGYLAVKGLRGRNRYQTHALATAEWMRSNLPADAIVAAWNAGIYGFYSGRPVVNLDGLINDDIFGWLRSGRPIADYLRRLNVRYVVDDADADQRNWFHWNADDQPVVRRGTAGARSIVEIVD